MPGTLSKTQIDRLGDRLKKGNITEPDLRLLDQYRRSFTEAYEVVVGTIRNELGLEPTGRPAKSTTSITDKLRRESIRLTQIQDIAGCRLIVPDIISQEQTIQSLTGLFEHFTVIDRRERPSHGYRAVHVVVRHEEKLIEIQVRTAPQHLWAELSEKISDVIDPMIKYGGGREAIQSFLTDTSIIIADSEVIETEFMKGYAQLSSKEDLTEGDREELVELRERMESERQRTLETLRKAINIVRNMERQR